MSHRLFTIISYWKWWGFAIAILLIAVTFFPKPSVRGAAAITLDRELHLGPIDLNNQGTAKIGVTNSGSEPLVIARTTSNCNCQAVYVEGIKEAIRDLAIPPGQSVTLCLNFVASGPLSLPSYMYVDLYTNDPLNEVVRVTIDYTPTAKLYFVPQTLVFGDVSPGETRTANVTVFADNRAEKIRPGTLACNRSDLFNVSFIPKPSGKEDADLGNSIAVEVGSLEISLRSPTRPQELVLALLLQQDNKEIVQFPVYRNDCPKSSIFSLCCHIPTPLESRQSIRLHGSMLSPRWQGLLAPIGKAFVGHTNHRLDCRRA